MILTQEILKIVRHEHETKFRYQLYNDMRFSFFPSMSIYDIIQSFDDPEYGYIGTLHLKFKNDNGNKYYEGIWYDNATKALEVVQQIQKDKFWNEDLLIRANLDHIESKYGNPAQTFSFTN